MSTFTRDLAEETVTAGLFNAGFRSGTYGEYDRLVIGVLRLTDGEINDKTFYRIARRQMARMLRRINRGEAEFTMEVPA